MSKTNLLAAFIGGAAAGAVVGLLMAPQSGADTRKKLLKTKERSQEYLNDLVEKGKQTWYETKGRAKEGLGIAAEEIDDFARHMLQNGEKGWKKAKDAMSDAKNKAENAGDQALENGKRTVSRMAS